MHIGVETGPRPKPRSNRKVRGYGSRRSPGRRGKSAKQHFALYRVRETRAVAGASVATPGHPYEHTQLPGFASLIRATDLETSEQRHFGSADQDAILPESCFQLPA